MRACEANMQYPPLVTTVNINILVLSTHFSRELSKGSAIGKIETVT